MLEELVEISATLLVLKHAVQWKISQYKPLVDDDAAPRVSDPGQAGKVCLSPVVYGLLNIGGVGPHLHFTPSRIMQN